MKQLTSPQKAVFELIKDHGGDNVNPADLVDQLDMSTNMMYYQIRVLISKDLIEPNSTEPITYSVKK